MESQTVLPESIQGRLKRVEGQIRGIQKMIDENRDCESIVTQLMAARAALDKASLLIITQHVRQCLVSPEGSEPANMERVMRFLLRLAPGSESE
ncbi:MAG: metal-sensitive transcriptional regulator [Chloroflexi bacterium]|nr:metal-sensitive transcriptional regulator [Chloroflexota bacterium]